MLYNRCTGIYNFGHNTYPRRIRRRLNLGHILGVKSVFYGLENMVTFIVTLVSCFNKQAEQNLELFTGDQADYLLKVRVNADVGTYLPF